MRQPPVKCNHNPGSHSRRPLLFADHALLREKLILNDFFVYKSKNSLQNQVKDLQNFSREFAAH